MLIRISAYILVLFFFSTSVVAKEYFKLDIPNTINIELTNKNYSKYIKNGFRAYADGSTKDLRNIKKKYKNWIEAKILLSNQEKINGKIRIMGDWKDHLQLPLTSLKVKIIDDNYFGLKRFNLFLPNTRNGVNEIYWTLLLKNFGYPTFYTRIINVNLNGINYKAIFQEDATKEFLERNSFRETVILKKNDYSFYLDKKSKENQFKFFNQSMIIDNNKFLKNETSIEIVSQAISLFGFSDEFKKRIIDNGFFEEINNKYANHALDEMNRKYIFLPYNNTFVPLYYDGMVDFGLKKHDCNLDLNISLISFTNNYEKLTGDKISKKQKCIFQELSSLYNDYKQSKTSKNNKYINANAKISNHQNQYIDIKNKIINYLNNKTLVNKINENGIIYTFSLDKKYFACVLNIDNTLIDQCQNISQDQYIDYLTGNSQYTEFKNLKFFPINLGSFNIINQTIKLVDQSEVIDKKFILDQPNLYLFYPDSNKKKKYNFIFQNPKAKLIIHGETSNNNEFHFRQLYSKKIDRKLSNNLVSRYDSNLLTGCVTFINVNFNGGTFSAENMKCEDSINILYSKGYINKILIKNSEFDGLDIDFSTILIKKMNVNNSGNDCADFSFGKYQILESKMNNCNDKAFSFGEKSRAIVRNTQIKNSLMGIVSKDESIVEVSNSNGVNLSKYCLAAYNLKSEFEGAQIISSNFKCDNINYLDNKSIIK